MKLLPIIFTILCACGPLCAHKLDPYGKQSEVAQFYELKDSTLWLQPFMYDKVWYKGKRILKDFEIRAGDYFWVMRGSKYHKFTFHGPQDEHLSFTRQIFSYTLGPEKDKRRKIILGRMIEKHDFLTDQSYWLLVDYKLFLESAPSKDRWKTR